MRMYYLGVWRQQRWLKTSGDFLLLYSPRGTKTEPNVTSRKHDCQSPDNEVWLQQQEQMMADAQKILFLDVLHTKM